MDLLQRNCTSVIYPEFFHVPGMKNYALGQKMIATFLMVLMSSPCEVWGRCITHTGGRCEIMVFVRLSVMVCRHAVHSRGTSFEQVLRRSFGSNLTLFSPFFSEGIALSDTLESSHFHHQLVPQFSPNCSQKL